MTDRRERAVRAMPMYSGSGMSPSMGVAAPIGAVSRKDRQRAARTSLRRDAASGLVLVTALPGSVSLQRRATDGGWETVRSRPASRLGRTRIELPDEPGPSPQAFRVVFTPKNSDITSWISQDIAV